MVWDDDALRWRWGNKDDLFSSLVLSPFTFPVSHCNCLYGCRCSQYVNGKQNWWIMKDIFAMVCNVQCGGRKELPCRVTLPQSQLSKSMNFDLFIYTCRDICIALINLYVLNHQCHFGVLVLDLSYHNNIHSHSVIEASSFA